MKYDNIVIGKFKKRPNRFVAEVEIDGVNEIVHVKNTGRCKELLLPDSQIALEKASNPNRKTKYDLVAVIKSNLGWVNIDSQLPNKLIGEWLEEQEDYTYVKPEFSYGKSRIDFYLEKDDQKYLMEVKGCTLEIDGVGYFPDAPTERGVKHLRELTSAVKEGYKCIIAFVIPMEKVTEVRPNNVTHPEFGQALQEALDGGVEVHFYPCRVEADEVRIINKIVVNNKSKKQDNSKKSSK